MRKLNKNLKLKATTLLELVIYIGVAAIIGLVVVNFWQVIQQTNQRNQVVQLTTQQADSAMQVMLYLVEISDSITAPTTGNNGSSLQLVISGQNNTVSVQAGRLRLAQGANTIDLTTSDFTVANFNVSNAGSSNDSIQISFELTPDNPDNEKSLDFTYSAAGNYARPY